MGSSLTGVAALCPWARHINPSFVLVQPRKTRPCITERLLMGRKESNQTNKYSDSICYYYSAFKQAMELNPWGKKSTGILFIFLCEPCLIDVSLYLLSNVGLKFRPLV